jgi:hypothetical protein
VQKTLDILKMDIEYSEWGSLTDMAAKGELKKIRQLFVEFHLKKLSAEETRRKLSVLASIERHGFKKFYTHMNFFCGLVKRDHLHFPIDRTSCMEVYFVNTNLARQGVNNNKQ